jgi:TolA-binding protein
MEILSWLMKVPGWLNAFDELQLPLWGVVAAVGLASVAAIFAARELLGWLTKSHSVLDELGELEINLMEQMNANSRELHSQIESLREEIAELRRASQAQRTQGQAATLLRSLETSRESDSDRSEMDLALMGRATPLPPIPAELRNPIETLNRDRGDDLYETSVRSPLKTTAERPRQFPLRQESMDLR